MFLLTIAKSLILTYSDVDVEESMWPCRQLYQQVALWPTWLLHAAENLSTHLAFIGPVPNSLGSLHLIEDSTKKTSVADNPKDTSLPYTLPADVPTLHNLLLNVSKSNYCEKRRRRPRPSGNSTFNNVNKKENTSS